MTLPPFQLPNGKTPSAHEAGRPAIWFAVGALLALFMALALASNAMPVRVVPERLELMRLLEQHSEEYEQAQFLDGLDPGDRSRAVLQKAVLAIKRLNLQTDGAKGAAARAMLILRSQLNPQAAADFSGLNASTDDLTDRDLRDDAREARTKLNAALRTLYSRRVGREEARRAKQAIFEGGVSWPITLALERANRILGIDMERRKLIAGTAVIAGLVAGLGVWGVFFRLRVSGRIRPRGVPLEGRGVIVADSLAARMLGYLLLFVVASLIGLSLDWLPISPSGLDLLVMGVVTLAGLALARMPFLGIRLSLREIGLRSRNVPLDILWGVGAWLANLPVLLVMLILGKMLFRWVPSGEHPVQQQVMAQGALLPTIIAVAVLAPIVEELFFRGCLYQGLALRLRNAAGAVALAGFAFAAIHPQGGALWLPLGWIGAMGALLTRERGSLLPAIVMHSLNNLGAVLWGVYLNG